MTSTAATCPACGTTLAAGTLLGNCPDCLLRMAADASRERRQPVGGSAGRPTETSRFFGDYELGREIARGGMGIVYEARQVSLNRKVALKMVAAGQLSTPALAQRFRLEAEAAARLQHPNIVPIYEVGEHEGQHFYSMKLVTGGCVADWISPSPEPLAEAVNPDGPTAERSTDAGPGAPAATRRSRTVIPFRDVARMMARTARAVQAAHEHGVLHRDLKPMNVLLDEAGEPHVTDFGLAKLVENDWGLTQTNATLGTPAYMAPEQAAGGSRQVTIATDVYGLGAILYDLLTGRPPFAGPTALETMRRVMDEEVVAPRRWNPWVDRDLEAICLKCLHKQPRARYASAEALAEELDRWQAGEPVQARRVTSIERWLRWTRRKPALASALGGAILLLLIIVIGLPLALVRIHRAEREAVAKLRESYLAQARVNRLSNRPGQRLGSLEIIRQASALNPSPELRLALRHEAIACLALTDVRVARQWPMSAGRWEGRLCFDPDVQWYAIVPDKSEIIVRRVADDREIAVLPAQASPVSWIDFFSPDRQHLAAYHQRDAHRIWNIARREVVLQVPATSWPCFSPDGAAVAVAHRDGRLSFHDLASAQEPRHVQVGRPLLNPKYHPGGAWLAGVTGTASNTVVLVETASGRIRHELSASEPLKHVAFSADGRWLAAGGLQGQLIVWNADTGERRWSTTAHESQVNNLGFSRTGELLATCSWEGTFKLWDNLTGRPLLSGRGTSYEMQFAPDDRMLAHVQEVTNASVLEIVAHPAFRLLQPADGAGSRWSVDFSPDGRTVAMSGEAVRFWDWPTGRQLAVQSLPDSRSVQFFPDGRSLLTSGAAGLLRWEVRRGTNGPDAASLILEERPRRLLAETNLAHAVLSADGRTVAVADRRRQRALVLPADGSGESGSVAEFGPHPGIQYVALGPGGRLLATGPWQGDGIKIWEVTTRRLLAELPAAGHARAAFSPDGRWLAVTATDIRIYECGTWQVHRTLPVSRRGVALDDVAFSPDGSLLAIGDSPRGVQLFASSSGERLAILEAPFPAALARVTFSPDSARLAALQYNRAVQVWDLTVLRTELAQLGLDW